MLDQQLGTATPGTDQVVAAIRAGDYDDTPDAAERFAAAFADRARALGRGGYTMTDLRAGDVITLSENGRPRYLAGLKARVVKKNKTRILVDVVDEHRVAARRFGEGPFHCPLALVGGVERPESNP